MAASRQRAMGAAGRRLCKAGPRTSTSISARPGKSFIPCVSGRTLPSNSENRDYSMSLGFGAWPTPSARSTRWETASSARFAASSASRRSASTRSCSLPGSSAGRTSTTSRTSSTSSTADGRGSTSPKELLELGPGGVVPRRVDDAAPRHEHRRRGARAARRRREGRLRRARRPARAESGRLLGGRLLERLLDPRDGRFERRGIGRLDDDLDRRSVGVELRVRADAARPG